LMRIASVLDSRLSDYRATLDGNEQYDDVEGIVELWHRIAEEPKLARLAQSTLFIEQPIKRTVALSRSAEQLAKMKPVIIDESDAELSSYPTALTLRYAVASSKNGNGVYKATLITVHV